jgi:hypothetical protein
MTKVEAIKKVLEDNNGIATWNVIYNQIEKFYPDAKNSKQWQAGIRGVLYREIKKGKNFKKVGLGLIGLLDFKEEEFKEVKKTPIRMHTYMEGICIEIGNFLGLSTYTADPSGSFNNLSLSTITTLAKVPPFSYSEIVEYSKRIDVLWFNDKGYKFPKRAIEIIDSIGTLESALKRTFQLLEFNLNIYLLCKSEHISKIEREINSEPYIRVKDRYKVKKYESILDIYKNPLIYKKDDFLNVYNHY